MIVRNDLPTDMSQYVVFAHWSGMDVCIEIYLLLRETLNLSMCADSSTDRKREIKIRCQKSGLRSQVSGVRYQVSPFMCNLSPFTCQQQPQPRTLPHHTQLDAAADCDLDL